MVKINPEMVVLAREYRGLTQEELARKLYVSQAKIARIEGGLQREIPEVLMDFIVEALSFPHDFFTQNEDRIGFGSSAYFYRKKSDLSASDRKRVHGLVNLLRIGVKRYMSFVEVGAKRPLPVLDLANYGNSPTKIAQALRGMWKLPDGPIKNLTALVESAGVIVMPCDFGTRSIDATSLRLTEMPPLIFINFDIPGDRWRFTLCHELGHLIMHDIPVDTMEDEADAFAAEFLMPEVEMRAQFSQYSRLRLQDFRNFKQHWKTSMGSLIERAHDLQFLDDNQRRYLWITMSKLDFRLREPDPIEVEQPKTFKNIVQYFLKELKYGPEDFQKLLKLNPLELESLHGVSSFGAFVENPMRGKLKIVQGGA